MVVGSAQRWNPLKGQADVRFLRWSCLEVCRSGQRSCGHPCAVLRVRWPAAPQQPAPASFLPTAEGPLVICRPSVPWSMSVGEPGDQTGGPQETSPPLCTPEGRRVGLWGEPVLSPPSMVGATSDTRASAMPGLADASTLTNTPVRSPRSPVAGLLVSAATPLTAATG
jgi:hypothetical protein